MVTREKASKRRGPGRPPVGILYRGEPSRSKIPKMTVRMRKHGPQVTFTHFHTWTPNMLRSLQNPILRAFQKQRQILIMKARQEDEARKTEEERTADEVCAESKETINA